MKPKVTCSVCGLTRNAAVHVGSGYEHDFRDSRPSKWRKDKAAQIAKEPECALAGLGCGPCWGPIDIHHATPRGSGGTSFDDSPLKTLCRGHHSWAEEHREEARELGLLMRRQA